MPALRLSMKYFALVILCVASCSNVAHERPESPTSKRTPDPVLADPAPHGDRCSNDKDCAGGTVCTTSLPTTGGAQPRPMPPPPECHTDTECGARARCVGGSAETVGYCQQVACEDDAACPQYHHCQQLSCYRNACQTDGQCGNGFCVNRQCSARSGACVSMAIMQPA